MKIAAVVLIALFCNCLAYTQIIQSKDSIILKEKIPTNTAVHPYENVGALVSYYFWEEDSLGYIVNQEIKKPFLQNYFIECTLPNKAKDSVSYADMIAMIGSFAHDAAYKNELVVEKKNFEIINNVDKRKVYFPFVREEAEKRGSVIHIQKNGQWISMRRHMVLYITITSDNKWKYYYSSDSLVLHKHKIHLLSNSQYLVLTYLKGAKKSIIRLCIIMQDKMLLTFF